MGLSIKDEIRYTLAPYTQAREEDFGLLFYTMKGPRLYFLSTGQLLDSSFFRGEFTLEEWLKMKGKARLNNKDTIAKVKKSLEQLCEKGVIC